MASVFDTWRITKSRHTCRHCEAQFAENQVFFSCLSEQDEGFVRLDFCPGCWEGRDTEAFFCFWRSRRGPSDREQVADTQMMLEFFDRLDSPNTEGKKIFRFVLALYLMRRKEFKLLEVARGDGTEALLFERRSTGKKMEVDSPGLTEDQIQETAAQLGQLLDASL